METLRVVILHDGERFVAHVLERDLVSYAASAFAVVDHIGRMFDALDAFPSAMPIAGAPAEYVALWEAGVDLGEVELGATRRVRVRMVSPLLQLVRTYLLARRRYDVACEASPVHPGEIIEAGRVLTIAEIALKSHVKG